MGHCTYAQAELFARNTEAAQTEQAHNKSPAALSGISPHTNDNSSITLSHQLNNLQHQFQQMQASLSRLESQRSINLPPSLFMPPLHSILLTKPLLDLTIEEIIKISIIRANPPFKTLEIVPPFKTQRNRLPNGQQNSYRTSPGVTICLKQGAFLEHPLTLFRLGSF